MKTPRLSDFPYLGFGVGLRHEHFDVFREKTYGKVISWVEALTENYLPWQDGVYRRPFSTLVRIRRDLPVALHGVSLSIGSADPLNQNYLRRLKDLADRIEPAWISDHICWTSVHGVNHHDLLPLPYTEEAVSLVVEKVKRVQDFLGRRILLENASTYLEFASSTMTEWEFVAEIIERADCGILLDLNNIYVSSVNHSFDSRRYLEAIPRHRIGQIHLAGHTNKGTYCIDTHDEPICAEVLELYRGFSRETPHVSTMVEWDDQIPEWPRLEEEVKTVVRVWRESQQESQEQSYGIDRSDSVSI